MTPSQKRLYIQQVSDMTGLSRQVIRKWEERYDCVQPERMPNGYRVYGEEDVNLLLRVKALSDEGMAIRDAVTVAKDELASLSVKEISEPPAEVLNSYVLDLLEKGSRCDETELQFTLQEVYHQVGLSVFLSDIIVPFLQEVGARWHRREWTEHQESVSSLLVRDFLVQVRRNFHYRPDAPIVLGACLPFEQHEVPLHILLLQFAVKGWRTILVGTSPAPGSIQALVDQFNPRVVILSASTQLPFQHDPHLIDTFDDFARERPGTVFFMGGKGAVEYAAGRACKALHVTDDVQKVIHAMN